MRNFSSMSRYIKFLEKLKKNSTETLNLRHKENISCIKNSCFEINRFSLGRGSKSEWPCHPVKMKTDENVEELRTVVRTGCRSGMRISAGELSVGREMIRQILTTGLNMKEVVCESDPQKSLSEYTSVFNWKTNTSAQTRSVPSRSYPVILFSFLKTQKFAQSNPFSVIWRYKQANNWVA